MNPHEVLGVAQDATPEQIKSAYRKLAMKHHPDKGGNQAEFQKIQDAYQSITKPKPQQQRQADPFAGGEHPFQRHGFAWEFFNEQQRQRRNQDFNVQAAITLEQAYNGVELSVTINGKVITIKVPRGVQHGHRLKLEGEGAQEFADLPAGHLYVVVMLRNHPTFQFQGHDLYMLKEIDVLDMMAGCDIEVTTIAGDKLSVHVPAGSKPSTRLRIPNKGMPVTNTEGVYGALYVALNPLFPDLTPEQIAAIKAIRG